MCRVSIRKAIRRKPLMVINGIAYTRHLGHDRRLQRIVRILPEWSEGYYCKGHDLRPWPQVGIDSNEIERLRKEVFGGEKNL